jgi:hypothetical protein
VRVPVSQLKDTALNRLTKKVRQNLWVFLLAKKLDVQHAHDLNLFLQLISDRKRDQHELYEELASFTGGKPEDFMTSNLCDEQQWIADLFLKLEVTKMVPCTLVFFVTQLQQSLRSKEAIQTYVNKTSAMKQSSIICAASLAAIRIGRHMLLISPPEILKAISYVDVLLVVFILKMNA